MTDRSVRAQHRAPSAGAAAPAAVPVAAPAHPPGVAAAPAVARAGAFDLEAAYDDHAGVMLGLALGALGDRGAAEDCVQETFLRAWRARDRFDPTRSSLRTWLFAIERNVIIDAHRASGRAPRITGDDGLEHLPAREPDPSVKLHVAEALATLSDEHREVLVAVHVLGVSYAELSAECGVPVPTLRTRAFYALRALRLRLGQEGAA
jgi:RNA polymerase sigma-70 factor, ECF subfamily